MGLIKWIMGGGVKQVSGAVETVGGVFRPNAENSAVREHSTQTVAMQQYAAEFHHRANRTWLDALADGLNRLVRPMITLTVFAAIPATMVWPEHMAIAMAALAILPVGYWAVLNVVMGFYFGGRMQIKAQEFKKDLANTVTAAPRILDSIRRARDHLSPEEAADDDPELALEILDDLPATDNTAVADWRKSVG